MIIPSERSELFVMTVGWYFELMVLPGNKHVLSDLCRLKLNLRTSLCHDVMQNPSNLGFPATYVIRNGIFGFGARAKRSCDYGTPSR